MESLLHGLLWFIGGDGHAHGGSRRVIQRENIEACAQHGKNEQHTEHEQRQHQRELDGGLAIIAVAFHLRDSECR